MSSVQQFRIISDKPRLAMVLREFDLGILPKDVREWAISWVEDVGTLVRSRDMMVGFAASLTYYIVAFTLMSMLKTKGLLPIR